MTSSFVLSTFSITIEAVDFVISGSICHRRINIVFGEVDLECQHFSES